MSPNDAFQFKLLDATGAIIPQEPQWANDHAQIGYLRYKNPRFGIMYGYLGPEDKSQFEFNLEDVYEDRLSLGKILEITWENKWYNPDDVFDVPERKMADGKIIPAHKEKIHFPGLWELSVSLPLQPESEIEIASPANDQVILPPPSDDQSKQTDASKPRPMPNTSSADSLLHDIVSTPNPMWWALLIFPVTLIVWLVSRRKKEK